MGDGGIKRLTKRVSSGLADRLQRGTVQTQDGMQLYKYGEGEEFDAELYKAVQTEANLMKIDNQWVPESHIKILADYMLARDPEVRHGICHGTRRGNEQAWFRQHLGEDADVFGTEISTSATDFPHTIQWDFHDVDPQWVGAKNFVYSNSWDHAHDPRRAIGGWIECLAPGGFLFLDHGWNYLPDRVSAMDPFGITEQGLVDLLNDLGAGKGAVAEVIEGGKHKALPIRTVVFRRNPA